MSARRRTSCTLLATASLVTVLGAAAAGPAAASIPPDVTDARTSSPVFTRTSYPLAGTSADDRAKFVVVNGIQTAKGLLAKATASNKTV